MQRQSVFRTMPSNLIFFGGVGRIGGNSILIEDGDTLVVFDLGRDFDQYGKFFEFPFTKPIKTADLIKTNNLPQITDTSGRRQEIYAYSDGRNITEPREEARIKAVFVTHSHQDHIGLIPHLRSDLSVHMGSMTNVIQSTLKEMQGTPTLEDKLYWEHNDEGNRKTRLTIREFTSGARIKVDGITVRPFGVDHSVPGAYGFLIETKDFLIAYTGDMRFHGPVRELSERFASVLESEPPDLLICEGTNMNYGSASTEDRVAQDAQLIVGESLSQGNERFFVEVKSTDLDRINLFINLAKEMGLEALLSPRLAYLLMKIKESKLDRRLALGIPDMSRELKVIVRERKKQERWITKLLKSKGVSLCDYATAISRKGVILDTGRPQVFHEAPPHGSLYIQSISEHVSEEREFGEERFLNSLALHGVIVYRLHSSGHASPLDLIKFVRRVKPKLLVPIHTEHPETFSEIFRQHERIEVSIPIKSVPMKLSA